MQEPLAVMAGPEDLEDPIMSKEAIRPLTLTRATMAVVTVATERLQQDAKDGAGKFMATRAY